MKIIVLDSRPTDVGDLDWAPLRSLGDLTLYETTPAAEVLARIGEAEVVFTNKVKITREAIEAAPKLKYIGELATGYDNIDIAAARERDITVCNVAGYSSAFTAQTAWALILELCARAGAHSELVHAGKWAQSPVFSFWDYPLVELDGKSLLIVGLGNIGTRVAKIGEAMGMKAVAAITPGREGETSPSEFPRVALDEALKGADVVSLHAPLSPGTRGLMNAQRLAMMKRGALLVNTGRGPLVDDNAVAEALRSGQLGGFAADVLFPEPPPAEHPLYGAPNCILTPHLGWASPEARARLLADSIENLRAFVAGAPRNVVS